MNLLVFPNRVEQIANGDIFFHFLQIKFKIEKSKRRRKRVSFWLPFKKILQPNHAMMVFDWLKMPREFLFCFQFQHREHCQIYSTFAIVDARSTRDHRERHFLPGFGKEPLLILINTAIK